MESPDQINFFGTRVCDTHRHATILYRKTAHDKVFDFIVNHDYPKLLAVIDQIEEHNVHAPGNPYFPCFSLQYADNVEMATFIIQVGRTPCFSFGMCNYSRMMLNLPLSTGRVAFSDIEAALQRADLNAVRVCIDNENTLPFAECTWKHQQQFLNDRVVQTVLLDFCQQRFIQKTSQLSPLPSVLWDMCVGYIHLAWTDISKQFYRSSLYLPPQEFL